MQRRSPCGERGLKFCISKESARKFSRSPCGERGLKCFAVNRGAHEALSLPMRGAWIEIYEDELKFDVILVAPHAGSVD